MKRLIPLLLVLPLLAHAEDPYVNVSMGSAAIRHEAGSAFGVQIGAGTFLNDTLGVEGTLHVMGTLDTQDYILNGSSYCQNGQLSSSVIGGGLISRHPVTDQIRIMGRLGLAMTQVSITCANQSNTIWRTNRKTGAYGGLALGYQLGEQWIGELRYDAIGTDYGGTVLSIGIHYTPK